MSKERNKNAPYNLEEGSEESLQFQVAAKSLGGNRLANIVNMMIECHCLVPTQERDIVKYRKVGKLAVKQLKQLGLVCDTQSKEMSGLTKDVANLLLEIGVTSKEQARAKVVSGDLRPSRHYNYGLSRHRQVCEWVGLPEFSNWTTGHKPKLKVIPPLFNPATSIKNSDGFTNPMLYDTVSMGVPFAKNVMILCMNHTSEVARHMTLVHRKTGERVRINFPEHWQ